MSMIVYVTLGAIGVSVAVGCVVAVIGLTRRRVRRQFENDFEAIRETPPRGRRRNAPPRREPPRFS